MSLLLVLWGCAPAEPAIVAHRALGILPDAEENQPDHIAAAFEAGFGAEMDLRLDGEGCGGDRARAETEGCFDLGHAAPNGHTFNEVVGLLSGLDAAGAGPTLVLDVVNDPDRLVSMQLIPYLASVLPGTALEGAPILIQSSSLDSVAMLYASREALNPGLDLRLGVTYFSDPELTVPDYVDVVVANIAELPTPAMPVPVAVFGVGSLSSMKAALYSQSDVQWIITDVPTRVDGVVR